MCQIDILLNDDDDDDDTFEVLPKRDLTEYQ